MRPKLQPVRYSHLDKLDKSKALQPGLRRVRKLTCRPSKPRNRLRLQASRWVAPPLAHRWNHSKPMRLQPAKNTRQEMPKRHPLSPNSTSHPPRRATKLWWWNHAARVRCNPSSLEAKRPTRLGGPLISVFCSSTFYRTTSITSRFPEW